MPVKYEQGRHKERRYPLLFLSPSVLSRTKSAMTVKSEWELSRGYGFK